MEAKTTAVAILAAGAMIAAAVYFKPMPGRYEVPQGTIAVRLDTATGKFDRCDRIDVNGKTGIGCAPFEEW
jgi:hypothetical protein